MSRSFETYGIWSNRFLDKQFKTVRYELTVKIFTPTKFHYKEDIQLAFRDSRNYSIIRIRTC